MDCWFKFMICHVLFAMPCRICIIDWKHFLKGWDDWCIILRCFLKKIDVFGWKKITLLNSLNLFYRQNFHVIQIHTNVLTHCISMRHRFIPIYSSSKVDMVQGRCLSVCVCSACLRLFYHYFLFIIILYFKPSRPFCRYISWCLHLFDWCNAKQ